MKERLQTNAHRRHSRGSGNPMCSRGKSESGEKKMDDRLSPLRSISRLRGNDGQPQVHAEGVTRNFDGPTASTVEAVKVIGAEHSMLINISREQGPGA